MKRHSVLNGLTLDVNNQNISISDNSGTIAFSLGEGDKLADLVGVLSKMKGLDAFPPVIRTSPFTTTINDDIISIKHNNQNNSISTSWSKLDFFVEAVYNVMAIAKDMASLGNDKAQNMSTGFNNGLAH